MSKSEYRIELITKQQCKPLLDEYHYLTNISKGFKSGYNYGLYKGDDLVGVCIYTGFPVYQLVQGLFGLDKTDQEGMFELSRLCIHPDVQSSEHNITSWFTAKTIKFLLKETKVRALLSYADTKYHSGTIYKALGFKYYGLTDPKKDFFVLMGDGSWVHKQRGKVKGLQGEWRPRTRKHRYLKIFDKSLEPKWKEEIYLK